MKEITLSKGYVATINNADYRLVSKRKWYAKPYRGRVYAMSSIWNPETKKTEKILMHRLIMNAVKGEEIDHRRGNGLDNRRRNLRRCTHSQNIANQGPRKDNKCGTKGVRQTREGNWQAYLTFDGKLRCLGTYKKKSVAAKVYAAKVKEVRGDFARVA